MENLLPRYKKPLPSPAEPKVDIKFWDEAKDAFDKKEFRKSVILVINYINPDLLKDVDTEKDIHIVRMQGSAEIQLTITKDIFRINVPFLKITEKTNEVALLRKVAEVNFSPLILAQIHLENQELWFKYEMPIILCQPNKVYDTLREVAVFSDDFDDIFIDKYKAEFYKKSARIELSASDLETVWGHISEILEDFQKYSKFFKAKRWDSYQWDLIAITLLKLSNMPYLNGKIRSDLEEYIRNLFNTDIDYHYRVDRGTEFIKKLASKSKEDWLRNIYHTEKLLSIRWRSSVQIMKDQAGKHADTVSKYDKKEQHFNLSYYLQFTLLKYIYNYNLDDNYKASIENVMEEVVGLSTEDAAPKLLKVYNSILEGNVSDPEKDKKKGFFSKLFG